jgi:hypothetical protein
MPSFVDSLSQTSSSFLTRSQSETISTLSFYMDPIGSTVLHVSPMFMSIMTVVTTLRSGSLTVTIYALAISRHAVLSFAHASAKDSVDCYTDRSTVVIPKVEGKMTERYDIMASYTSNILTQNRSRARSDVNADPRRSRAAVGRAF